MKKLTILTVVVMLFASVVFAVPDMMNYQGRAYSPPGSGTPVPDSTGNTVSIRIYANQGDAVGLWLWEQTIYNVETKNGYFNVQFGGFGAILDFSQNYWLGIEFNEDGEMTPRQQLLMAPYAGMAKFVEEVNTKTKIFGPIGLTSSSETEAGLTVTSTGSIAIVGEYTGGLSQKAGIAGYNYSSSSETAGVYGFGLNGLGVYGESSGTAMAGVQGEALYGIGVYGKGVTGVVAVSASGGTALLVDGNGSLFPMKVGGGASNNVLFEGPGLTIDSGGFPAALYVSFTAGSWPAVIIEAPVGQAMQIKGSNSGLGKAVVEVTGNTSDASLVGLGISSGGIGVSATASNGAGVIGIGVTGVAAIGVDPMNNLALYTEGKSYMYGSTTIVASGGADASGGAINVYNDAGTGYGAYIINPPGIAIYGSGAVGARGFGTDVGVEGIGASSIGSGVHTYNGSADGLQSGASLYVSGKIKLGSAGGINSPVGVASLPGGGINPSIVISNNLCGGIYHVFITPLNDWRDNAGTPVTYWIDKSIPGQFTIATNSNGNIVPGALNFEYLIINE